MSQRNGHHDTSLDPLIAAIDGRLEHLEKEEERHQLGLRRLEEEIGEARNRVLRVRSERAELERIRVRYEAGQAPRPAVSVTAIAASSQAPQGPSDTILALLRKQPDYRLDIVSLIDRVAVEIKSGAVATQTTDERKLASSTVGNLVRRGKLRRENDVIILNETAPTEAEGQLL